MLRSFGLIYLVAATTLAGCAARLDYSPPSAAAPIPNSRTIKEPKEQVWAKLIPAFSRDFFVINAIDKSSGLINISYGGNPEKYIDCGIISLFVKNARGERNYVFPASQAKMECEVMQNGLFLVDRRMSLEGRVNIVVETVGPKETRVTASTRYIVKKTVRVSDTGNRSENFAETASFNSGGRGAFTSRAANNQLSECKATGALEADILRLAGH